MNRHTVFILALFLSCGGAVDAQDWIKYVPPNNKYEVAFPGKPKEKKEKGFTHASFGIPDKKVVLGVEERDFVKKVQFTEAALKELLDRARDGTIKTFPKTELLSEKDTRFGNYRGREVTLRTLIGHQRIHFIVTPTRYFTVYVIGPKDYCEGAEAKKYLDSFKVTE